MIRGSRALTLKGLISYTTGRVRHGIEIFERALVHARRAESTHAQAEAVAWLVIGLRMGPLHAEAAIQRLEQILTEAGPHRVVEASTALNAALLYAIRGNPERARSCYRRGRATLGDLGMYLQHAASTQMSGEVELLCGDFMAAERELREGWEALTRMGERTYASTNGGLLAEALCEQGRYGEAALVAAKAKAAAGGDDIDAQVRWRAPTALALVQRGEWAAAQALAEEAVGLADATDQHALRVLSLRVQAEVLSAVEMRQEAVASMRQVLWLAEGKGDLINAARAQAWLER